jgi:hypothetical protein
MVTLLVTAAVTAACCSHTLTQEQTAFLASWLKQQDSWALTEDSDSSCPADIAAVRNGNSSGPWKPIPDFHPYQVVGDFDRDGLVDMAVVLKKQKEEGTNFALAVFNGPFTKPHAPAFLQEVGDMQCAGLFFGPPRPQPYWLVVGPFEAQGRVLVPDGPSYEWRSGADDE